MREVVKIRVPSYEEMKARLEAAEPYKPKKWAPTAEQAKIMREFWGKRSVRNIAETIGVSENTVRRWHSMHGADE